MKIREASRKDVKQINSLNQQLNEYHLKFDDYYKLRPNLEDITTKYFENIITSEDSILLVAEDNKSVVGYIVGKVGVRPPVYEVDKRGLLSEMYVLEKYRGRGVGRELTERMISWFKERSIKYVELSVDRRNDLGYNVWKSLGFETWQLVMKMRINKE